MTQPDTELASDLSAGKLMNQRPHALGARLVQRVARALPWRPIVTVLWALAFGGALLVLAASIPLGYALLFRGVPTGSPIDAPDWYVAATGFAYGVVSLLAAVLSLGLAGLLFWRRRDEPMALLVSFYLLAYGIVMAGPLEALNGFGPLFPPSSPSAQEGPLIPISWIWQLQNVVSIAPPLLFLYLFPNGRFVPRWTRWTTVLLLLITPAVVSFDWSAGYSTSDPVRVLVVALYLGSFGAGLYAQGYRYGHIATPIERQQIKWVAWGLALTFLLMGISSIPYFWTANLPPGTVLPAWIALIQLVWWVTIIISPVCLTVAVMRYRLWDIDVILSRSLVYVALTAAIVATYVFASVALGALIHSEGNLLVSLLATAAVAVLFQPLRERLQQGVNRLIYGERDDPYAVIARMGQRLEATLAPDAVLPAIVETVAQALKVPYVAIQLTNGGATSAGAIVAAHGQPRAEVITLPLVYQSETIGQLLVAPRGPGEAFSPADRRLLATIAQQAGVAAHSVRLTADLQHSRERLVTAREEERRRLRRDLHDGLGPALAAQTLKVGAARALYPRDRAAAEVLLAELERDGEAALTDVRRLVYDLRPPALDELGLVGAIREHAAQYRGGAPEIVVDAPSLPPLTAAVEVAAYRIVQEALANVVRHAGARHCRIELALNDALTVMVTDDGRGISRTRPAGVGLASMRERAAELGGTCAVEAGAHGGTRVTARLPGAAAHGDERPVHDGTTAGGDEEAGG